VIGVFYGTVAAWRGISLGFLLWLKMVDLVTTPLEEAFISIKRLELTEVLAVKSDVAARSRTLDAGRIASVPGLSLGG
jgi:hypothetical protein